MSFIVVISDTDGEPAAFRYLYRTHDAAKQAIINEANSYIFDDDNHTGEPVTTYEEAIEYFLNCETVMDIREVEPEVT